MILPKKRDPRLITIRRGGTLTDSDHRLLALWAAACAEHVLHLFEAEQPDDPRPRLAIAQARAWVRGEIKMSQAREAAGAANAAARELAGAARHAAHAAGQAAAVAHVAAHELGAAAYAIKAARAAAPEAADAGRLECRWQRDQLPDAIRELVLDDERQRNGICWSAFEAAEQGGRIDMSKLQESQYKDSSRFNARVLIHAKYGVNKTPWPIWLFEHYRFKDDARIVEFGCGNGLLWNVNSFRISPRWSILLTDFSPGMIDAAKASIGQAANISYAVIDLAADRMDGRRFDNIIANHMLYHVANLDQALGRLADLLEPDGELYCSTVGQTNMAEMKTLVKEYTGNDNYTEALGSVTDRFSLENGAGQLAKHFKTVKRFDFDDALEITSADDLVDYILSCNDLKEGLQVLAPEARDGFRTFVEQKIAASGKFHVSKSSGTFVAGGTG